MSNSFYQYTVKEEEAPFYYEERATGKCWHHAGDVIMMDAFTYAQKAPIQYVDKVDKCWPAECYIDGALVEVENRILRIVQPKTLFEIEVPKLCDQLPNKAFFNWCGDCFFIDVRKAIIPDAEYLDLLAPVMNPRKLWIGPNKVTGQEAVETIYGYNKGEGELCLSVAFTC